MGSEMNDKEMLCAMFDRAGVKYFLNDGSVEVYSGTGPNQGYTCFYTSFGFNEDGSLSSVGAWE
jgi:hypothetical protein